MSEQELYLGSVGPFYFDSVDDYNAGNQVARLSDLETYGFNNVIRATPEGGIALVMLNGSGATLKKGELVRPDINPNSVRQSVGVVGVGTGQTWVAVTYADVASAAYGLFVVYGICDVLLKDGTGATCGDKLAQSSVGGRAYSFGTTALASADDIMRHVGYAQQTVTSGTDIFVRAIISR